MTDQAKENSIETQAWTSQAARTAAVSHAVDKVVQAAQNLKKENDAKLLVKAIDTSLRAVLVEDSARDAFLLSTTVKAHFEDENRANTTTADMMTSADNVDRTESTAAAITASIKAAQNQKTEQSSKFLVDAVEASVRAAEGEDTVAYSQFIIAAVKAAVPDDASAVQKNREVEESSVGNENIAPRVEERHHTETSQKRKHWIPHLKVPTLTKVQEIEGHVAATAAVVGSTVAVVEASKED